MDKDTVDSLFSKLREGRPNTYAYTKALTEAFLETESGRLPIAIIRPSIVEAAWKEPFPVSNSLVIPLVFSCSSKGLFSETDLIACFFLCYLGLGWYFKR